MKIRFLTLELTVEEKFDTNNQISNVTDIYEIHDNYFVIEGRISVIDSVGNSIQYNSIMVNKETGFFYDFNDKII